MYCMKCGKDTKSDQIFCDSCLDTMKQSPVKPGTPIHLPTSTAPAVKEPVARKKQLTPEEQLPRLRAAVRTLVICLISAILALGLSITLLIHTLQQQPESSTPNGRNYTTADSDRAR